MAGTDFFDEDLQHREATRRRLAGTTAPPPEEGVGEPAGVQRPVSDLNLTRMARHRGEVEEQVANSTQELDRLRMRQEELERERRELEDLRAKQASYEAGKKEVVERLQQSLVMLEREHLRAERRVELMQGTRVEFKSMLDELVAIDEAGWPDEAVRDELTKCIVLIDECRMAFKKSMSRVDEELGPDRKVRGDRGGEETAAAWPTVGYWFKVGWVLSLPLLLGALCLAMLWWFNEHPAAP